MEGILILVLLIIPSNGGKTPPPENKEREKKNTFGVRREQMEQFVQIYRVNFQNLGRELNLEFHLELDEKFLLHMDAT